MFGQRWVHTVRPQSFVNLARFFDAQLNSSSATVLKSKIRIGCNSAMVEKNSSGRFCEFNVFVFDIQKWVNACISPLFTCSFNFIIEKHKCIFRREYGTGQYTILKLGYEIRSERLYYSYLFPSKLSFIDIEPIGQKIANIINISTISDNGNIDINKNTSIQNIILTYTLISQLYQRSLPQKHPLETIVLAYQLLSTRLTFA